MGRYDEPWASDAACRGKVRFEGYAAAERQAARGNRSHHGKSVLQPYRCRHCRGFHVGDRQGLNDSRRPRREPPAFDLDVD